MGDAGEGLIDADARIQERMEELERERKQSHGRVVRDPEKVQALESLRLARTAHTRSIWRRSTSGSTLNVGTDRASASAWTLWRSARGREVADVQQWARLAPSSENVSHANTDPCDERMNVNKRKKVAWHKHLKAARKKEAKRTTGSR